MCEPHRPRLDRVLRVLRICILFATIAFPASAEVVIGSSALTGGDAFTNGGTVLELTGTIGTISNNAFNDDHVRVFNEVQDLPLAAPLILDLVSGSLQSNVLGIGSVVSSHYVLFDPATLTTAIGQVTFDEPVLGIIRTNPRFNGTDNLLGNPSAIYAIGSQALENNDDVTISGNTVSFDLSSNSPGDAIRVVTGVDPVPGINVCAAGTETMSGVITGGDSFDNGGVFRQICDPIGDVGDDNFQSFDVYGFEEQQAVPLLQDLMLDTTNFIAAGETVSSYYVIFDPVLLESVVATITFPDTIIGVIDQQNELNLSNFLGDASANYLNPNLLGIEPPRDAYTFSGNDLTIDFEANSPGDSVRVILGSASPSLTFNICDPADVTLAGSVTGGSAAAAGGIFNQLCTPIGNVGNDNFQSDDLYAFEELQNQILASPIAVEEPAVAMIPIGTAVSSYYVVFDPGNDKEVVGSIQFPGPILGVMTEEASMSSSDFLGNHTATYLNPTQRGLEGGDSVSISGDTLFVTLAANSPGDSVRVIVEGSPAAVPAFDFIGQLGLAAAMLLAALSFIRIGENPQQAR